MAFDVTRRDISSDRESNHAVNVLKLVKIKTSTTEFGRYTGYTQRLHPSLIPSVSTADWTLSNEYHCIYD
jgi:hypothetical protein